MHSSRQTDEETSLEMKKMIKFITQEALEKAKEIEIRGRRSLTLKGKVSSKGDGTDRGFLFEAD